MKNLLPLSALFTRSAVEFLKLEFPSLPARLMYVPDLVVAGVMVIVAARLIATQRIFAVPMKYVLVFMAFCYVVVSAAVINDVSPQVSFAGVRNYFKYVPLFLIPFAYHFSAEDIRKQFVIVLGLALIQIPTTVRQRFFQFKASDFASGDVITGTFGSSGPLSIFLVCTIMVIVAFYLGRRISPGRTIVLCTMLLLPATINETKITPILLVIGGLGLLYAKRRQMAARQFALVASLIVLMAGIFIGIYNTVYDYWGRGGGYVAVMTSDNAATRIGLEGAAQVDQNAFRVSTERNRIVGKAARLVEGGTKVDRLGSLLVPFEAWLPDDPIHLLFGVGIGNVTSTYGDGGKYQFVIELGSNSTTWSQLMWECGLLGALIYFVFMVLILRDAFALADESEWSDLGAGWSSVCLIVLVICFYQSLFMGQSVLMLFIYFSGLVVAKRYESRVHLTGRARRRRSDPATGFH